MKKILILSLLMCVAFALQAQKSVKISSKVKYLKRNLSKDAKVSSKFKAVLGPIILANDDDDCTPPPCTGIIDPWTCECYSDIVDPWEEDKIVAKMKAIQRFEQGLKMGEGGSIIMIGEYKAAQKRFPGKSLKAMVNRLNYYADVASK
ncbi:MAG: hypothetical protein R8P61_31690 [Bacteroidia bacterium]|nr:hypothetical protein [Bacteroidia bacterium]